MKVTPVLAISSFLVAFSVILPSCSAFPPYYSYPYPTQNAVPLNPPTPLYDLQASYPWYGRTPYTTYPYYTTVPNNPSAKPATTPSTSSSSSSSSSHDNGQKPTSTYQEVYQSYVVQPWNNWVQTVQETYVRGQQPEAPSHPSSAPTTGHSSNTATTTGHSSNSATTTPSPTTAAKPEEPHKVFGTNTLPYYPSYFSQYPMNYPTTYPTTYPTAYPTSYPYATNYPYTSNYPYQSSYAYPYYPQSSVPTYQPFRPSQPIAPSNPIFPCP